MKKNGRNDKTVGKRNGGQKGQGPIQGAPVAFGQVNGSSRPQISVMPTVNGDLRVRVKHREYIQDVDGAVVFNTVSIPIQPGLSSSFPWLATIANSFESYRFNALKFQFRSSGATSSAGKAMLAVDWDAADTAPPSKAEMLQNRTIVDGNVWLNLDLVCDKADLLKFGTQRYTRPAALSANLDIKTYDVGTLIYGNASTAITGIGELWVEYDIELSTPQPSPLLSQLSGAKVVGATFNNNVFGSAAVVTGTGVTGAANTMSFAAIGEYLVVVHIVGTVLTGMTVNVSSTGTATLLQDLVLASGLEEIAIFRVQTNNPNRTLAIVPGSTSITASETRVSRYPYTLA